ncbi:hypothetical protein [Mycolicibacterium gadium]|jgi:hypothetical protein|uniref:hypothetical protein n=1 Tax=Mycolicibacterium gadium TaxID=1794 RepID=UPI002FDDF472
MASTNSSSSDTLKLDPAAAAGLITRGADADGQAVAAGATAGAAVGSGVSPIDAGVAALRAEGFAMKTGWIAAVSAKSVQRQVGETEGVEAMSQQESENAARLGEIGPQGAAATTTATIAI